MTVREALPRLLGIIEELRREYPVKQFTLDGRLLGDLGEVLVETAYDLTLDKGQPKHYDATCPDGRRVQIKGTMKNVLGFPYGYVPDYYIGIKIHTDGSFEEIFNGPGRVAREAVEGRGSRIPTGGMWNVPLGALRALNAKVAPEDRIPRR